MSRIVENLTGIVADVDREESVRVARADMAADRWPDLAAKALAAHPAATYEQRVQILNGVANRQGV